MATTAKKINVLDSEKIRTRLVDDQTFYDFVDRCKPDFVGAIHRQELV